MPTFAHRSWIRLTFATAILPAAITSFLLALTPAAALAAGPHWIAKQGNEAKERTWHFDHSFTASKAILSASLKLAADFCTAELTLNGQPVLTVEPYSPTQELDVASHMRLGKNDISLRATTVEGPSAIALSITLVDKEGTTTTVGTDGTWAGAVALGEVPPELWGVGRRSAAISPFDNYEQWQQAKGDAADSLPKFWLVPGFEVTRVRKAAADEGSWIALAFDAQGRATISREDTGLLRMTLADDRRSVTRVEPIQVDLPECRGLLYLDGTLYANANNAKTFVRLRITDDGKGEGLERLREFPGGVGHGRNDLALGPDGRIYSIHGDAVEAPGKPIFDRTSPLRESRRGPPRKEGYVVSTNRDGKDWQLLCTGLRNPYGIAFHPNGDLFTYDADNEFDMGTPWYRPTRVVQLVSGSDYGYRVAQDQWPPNYPDHPDNGLPTIDVGRGSPTSAMFGTKLAYPSPYREALYILDWAYGRVLAVHLAPRGAGYRASLELFMQGKPLNVTDLAVGPDGAMWLTTGGRKTQSALYRVAFTGKPQSPPVKGKHEQDAADFSEQQRKKRIGLEAMHGHTDKRDGCASSLTDADPLIRHAARIALEQLPQAELLAEFDKAPKLPPATDFYTRGTLESLMIGARTGNAALVPKLIDHILLLPVDKLDLSGKLTVVFLYRECLKNAADAVAGRREAIVRQLSAVWPDVAQEGLRVSPFGSNIELRRRLALLLADLGDAAVIDRAAKTLLVSPVQEDRLQGLLALRNLRQGWTPETRRTYFTTLREAPHFVGGDGLPRFIDRLRTDSLATLTDAERSQLADLLAPPVVQDEPLPPARAKVRAWTLDDIAALTKNDAPQGDARRGEKIFRLALCSRCHRAGLVGPAVGPDLTFVARRFSRRDILESIIAPSRSIAENYRNVRLVTEGGKIYVGRLLNEGDFRSEKLKLNTDPMRPSQVVEIDKKEIADERVHDTSPMPQGLLDTFSAAEIADLLSYLEAGRSDLLPK